MISQYVVKICILCLLAAVGGFTLISAQIPKYFCSYSVHLDSLGFAKSEFWVIGRTRNESESIIIIDSLPINHPEYYELNNPLIVSNFLFFSGFYPKYQLKSGSRIFFTFVAFKIEENRIQFIERSTIFVEKAKKTNLWSNYDQGRLCLNSSIGFPIDKEICFDLKYYEKGDIYHVVKLFRKLLDSAPRNTSFKKLDLDDI